MENKQKISDKRAVICGALILAVFLAAVIYYNFNDTKEEAVMVGVHVKGAVVEDGYYELPLGSRVKDAIAAAGGASENADLNNVNLAEHLMDGEELVIPYIFLGKININSASKDEIAQIEGVSEALAAKIIHYRHNNGDFATLEELLRVDGMSEDLLADILPNLTLN
ncbi:MAG: ComEA family DNA-binding protein [Clostridia bacterium]|nr:ComEA family DNA-binding protein [Clostridia bacterium]